MIRRKKESIEWLEFEQFQEFPELIHGVTLRHGGVSRDSYSSLNIGGGSGDDPELIAQNRKLFQECLGVGEVFAATQVHGNRVEWVDSTSGRLECDGLITKERGFPLLIKHADCQAALIYDPMNKVIGALHSGWRGSVGNIYGEAISAFDKPENLLVCISPSLGPCHAEFVNYKTELPEDFLEFQVSPNYFDFWQITKRQLLDAGVLDHHIEFANLCTFSEKDDFFSFRREKKTGRHGTVIALKD